MFLNVGIHHLLGLCHHFALYYLICGSHYGWRGFSCRMAWKVSGVSYGCKVRIYSPKGGYSVSVTGHFCTSN